MKNKTSKHDLAMAYFPTLKPKTAQRKLRRWLNGNPYLLKELKKRKYKISQKTLTDKQLHIIINTLGEP